MSRTRFMTPAAFVAAGLLLLAGCAGDGEPALPADYDEALSLAAAENSLVLVDFYTDW